MEVKRIISQFLYPLIMTAFFITTTEVILKVWCMFQAIRAQQDEQLRVKDVQVWPALVFSSLIISVS